jgi:U3 small nucleolar RNA-associated protein 12
MVKAYLRYELTSSWGVITSHGSNVAYDHTGKYFITAALENVSIWNVKTAVLVRETARV